MTENMTVDILGSIEQRFKRDGKYIVSEDRDIFCPHVNGLVNICLSELGYQDLARENCRHFLESHHFFQNLFYNEVDSNGRIQDNDVNSCRNAVMALGLISAGYFNEANNVTDALKQTSVFDSEKGLFKRQYNNLSGEINPSIITQTNLWIVFALTKLKREKEAKGLLGVLEAEKYDKSQGLFFSQDCRFQDSEKRFFCDDQALACLAYYELGEIDKSKELMRNMIRSQLYDGNLFNSSFLEDSLDDTSSTYKNGLCGIALGKLGFVELLGRLQKGLVEKLYDFQEGLFIQSTRDNTKIPDNSALALMALKYDNLRHVIF